jgi:hypothetical protein
MAKANGFSSTDLDILQRQLAAWRHSQPSRARLPDTLWSAAAALAKSEGVSWVARALQLDYRRLRRHCRPSGTSPAPSLRAPAFVEVELPPPRAAVERNCRIELCGSDGRRVVIELDRDPATLVAVVAGFLGRHP